MFDISFNNKQPIYEQLSDRITTLVLNGIIEPDSQLPSVRELATELAVNPNTVQKAFTELERNGVAYSVNGKGRFVTDNVENLRNTKIEQCMVNVKCLVSELVKYGATKDLVISRIDKYYEEGLK